MKLLLADDHTLFRDALLLYIRRAQPDVEVDVSKDFGGARDLLKQSQDYDLVLLDLRMPGMDGLNGLREVRQNYPDMRVVLMSGVAKPSDVGEALDIGASGYFPKTLSGRALIDAIQSVLDGEIYIPMDGEQIMAAYYDDQEAKAKKNAEEINLTPREMDVLTGLSEGLLNKEIAENLGIEVVTVKMHVRNICMKLDVQNRTQAALKARDLWLVGDNN